MLTSGIDNVVKFKMATVLVFLVVRIVTSKQDLKVICL